MFLWYFPLLLISFFLAPSGLSAVQVKISLPLPLSTQHSVEGFDNATLEGPSDFGVKVLTPVAEDTLMGLGMSKFTSRVVDGAGVSPKYTGVLEAIMFKLGVEYSGIELFQDFLCSIFVYCIGHGLQLDVVLVVEIVSFIFTISCTTAGILN